jgi:hypothetical protein
VLPGEFAANGRPYIRGELWIPRFNLRRDTRFCVDTGSAFTVLMPDDGFAIGVDYVKLDDEIDLATVGGATPTFLEPVQMSFTDSDARTAYSYRVMLALAPP